MRQLSAEHVVALAVTAAVAGGLVAAARRYPGPWVVLASRALAVLILAAYVAESAQYVARGTWSTRVNLPLHLTDVVTLVAVVALWTARPLAVELVYLWALTASLQAVLTPDLGEGFPSLPYFGYFATHSGAVIAACLLVFGRRIVPRPGAAWRAYAATALLAVVAGVVDLVTGANYMYLRRPPSSASLLDIMGPWPWYIASAAALGLVMFLALEGVAAALRRHDADALTRATARPCRHTRR